MLLSIFKKLMSFLDYLFKRAQEEAAQQENPAPLENAVVMEDNPAIPQTAPVETTPLEKNGESYLDTDDQTPPSMGDNVMAPENNPQVAMLTEEEVVVLEVQPESMRAETLPQENRSPSLSQRHICSKTPNLPCPVVSHANYRGLKRRSPWFHTPSQGQKPSLLYLNPKSFPQGQRI